MNPIAIAIKILIAIESGGDPNAIGDYGKAVGVLQIHKIMVDECNRIADHKMFKYEDREDVHKSKMMASVFLRHQIHRHYIKFKDFPTLEELCCSWNSGSIMKIPSQKYLEKVRSEIKRSNNTRSK